MEEERKKRKKRKDLRMQKAAGLMFIAILIVFLALNAVKKDREFSDKENRQLSQKPKLTVEGITGGSFMKNYETYESDQFAFREFWVSLKTKVSLIEGERKSGGVYKGKDHYLLEEVKEPDQEALEDNLEAIQSFKESHTDIPVYMMLVPNAANILKDKLPAFAVTRNQDAQLQAIRKKLGEAVTWVDVGNEMKKHKDEGIYYHTDHHWTTLGAYYGFMAFAEAAEIDTVQQETMEPYTVTDRFNGTLSSVSGYEGGYTEPIQIYYSDTDPEAVVLYVEQQQKKATLYDKDKLKEKDKYGMFLGGNYPLVHIRTTAEKEDVLLLMKDSYANCFLPFLCASYREIIVVDPRYYCGDVNQLMTDYQADQVLFLYNTNTFVEDNNINGVLADE